MLVHCHVQVVRATGEATLKTMNLDAETNQPVKPVRKLLDSLTGEFLDEHSYNTYQEIGGCQWPVTLRES